MDTISVLEGDPQYDDKNECNNSSRTGKVIFRTIKTVSCRRNEGRSDAINDERLYSFSSTDRPLECPDSLTRGLAGKCTGGPLAAL